METIVYPNPKLTDRKLRKRVSDDGQPLPIPEQRSGLELQLLTIGLLEKVYQSQKSLECRMSTLERKLLQTAVRKPSTYFPQFNRLPPEIRHRVWSLAIPCRVFRPMNPFGRRPDHDIPCVLRPPAIAHTCREARAVSCRHGDMFSLSYDAGLTRNSPTPAITYWTWFDGANDVLDLERWISVERDEPRGIKRLVEIAQIILAPRASGDWFVRLFRRAKLLKSIDLKLDVCHVDKSSWHPRIISQFFRGNTIRIIDLEDAKEIAAARLTLKSNWTSPFPFFDLEGWAASHPRKSQAKRDRAWMGQLDETWMGELSRGWLLAKIPQLAGWIEFSKGIGLLNLSEAPTLDVSCVHDTLVAMPEMRLVRAYQLQDGVLRDRCRASAFVQQDTAEG